MAIDENVLKQYLADSPPTIVPMAIKQHFETLSEKEKHYAHFLSVYKLTPSSFAKYELISA